jgi:hypothetical protein
MSRIIQILTIMIASSAFIFASDTPDESSCLDFENTYIPENSDVQLVFDSNFGETVTRYESGDNKFKIINESDKFLYIQEFTQNENGVFLTDTEQNIDIFWFITHNATIKYLTPALQVPIPLKMDQEWKWSGLQDIDGDTVKLDIQGKVIGEETIELPAGKYEALRIELIVDLEGGERSTVNQWFVKGLGTVKLHALVEDPGILGLAMKIFGYDEIYFNLKEIRNL